MRVRAEGRGWRLAAWLVTGAMAVGAVVAAFSGHWTNSLAVAGFTLAAALFLWLNRWLPEAFDLLLILAAAVNAAAWTWNLYDKIVWYDDVAHFLATLAVTLVAGFYLFRPVLPTVAGHPWVLIGGLLSVGIALGAIWELVEWVGYYLFKSGQGPRISDELADIAIDSAGAMVAIPLAFWGLATSPRLRSGGD